VNVRPRRSFTEKGGRHKIKIQQSILHGPQEWRRCQMNEIYTYRNDDGFRLRRGNHQSLQMGHCWCLGRPQSVRRKPVDLLGLGSSKSESTGRSRWQILNWRVRAVDGWTDSGLQSVHPPFWIQQSFQAQPIDTSTWPGQHRRPNSLLLGYTARSGCMADLTDDWYISGDLGGIAQRAVGCMDGRTGACVHPDVRR